MTAESRDGRLLAHGAVATNLRDAAQAVVEWATPHGSGEVRLPAGFVRTLGASLDAALDTEDWADAMLDALCASDAGNNPFYRDDGDTIALARELGDAVVARLRGKP